MSQCVEREEEGSDRPESPTSSCVSMKSDRSKAKPPEPGPLRWDSITALPLSAADMRKSWHKDISQWDRDLRVHWLVRVMSTGDPAEDIEDLVTDAQNIERNSYVSANSEEEYRRLLTEKRSELIEKKLMRMGIGSITALPLSAADMRKSWHKDYKQSLCDYYVRCLVMVMLAGDPAEDIKDLVTDAQNIERNIYESANSYEEYYDLVREKLSELLEKKLMRMGIGSITALPLSAADMRKSWHKDYKQSIRDYYVRCLVKDMLTGDPAEDIKDLVTDALNIERNMYESANSRDEYCDLVREKGSELLEKMLMRMGTGSITALPLSAADMRKSWHKDYTQWERDYYVRLLVKVMSTGDPAEDIKDLVTDAQNIERNIYESANSRMEYIQLIDEKRFELAKKSQMKMKMKQSGQMEMKSMDQTSTPPLPPDDKLHQASASTRKPPAFTNEPGPSHTKTKRPAKPTTDDDDWKCRSCGSRNTAKSLRCRDIRCKLPKSLSTSLDSITALPLSAVDMRKSWHKDITQTSRDFHVRMLVKDMSTGDPAENIKDLVTDAQNIERKMYESAYSMEEYWELMGEKSSELREKRLKSREMKQSGQMEMKSMDQTSTPPLPPGDKLSQSSSMMTEGQTYTPASVSSSTDLSSQHVQTGSSMTSQREVKMEEEEDEEGGEEGESDKVEGQPDVKMEEKPEGTIPLRGEMEDHPVTESQSSLHPSLELQDETDLNLGFSGLRIDKSIFLPRSHSLPSLSQIPCLENKTSFRAKRSHSVNDVTLLVKTQKITPDIIILENKESYRFHCTHAGLFQCNVTDLVFKMKTEGDVTYRTVHWDRRLLSQLDKRAAGPLFDIKGSQGSVCQLRFPHCEILSMGGGKSLSVLHVIDDDGFELIKPHVITETHVIIDVTGLSLFGIIMEKLFGPSPVQPIPVQPSPVQPSPVQALVSLFYTPPIEDDPSSILKVLLLPENVVLSEVMNKRREINGEEIYIEATLCKLIPKQEYTLSTSPQDDSIIVLPNKAEFEVDALSYHNYMPTFIINLEESFSHVRLLLSNSNTSSVCAWEGYAKLSAAALRKQQVQHALSHDAKDKLLSVQSSFIDSVSHPIRRQQVQCSLTLPAEDRLFFVRDRFIASVSLPNLNCLLDKLFTQEVLTEAEREMAAEMQAKKEKASFVIDTVRHKGPDASSSMILILCDLDTCLSKHLGLM